MNNDQIKKLNNRYFEVSFYTDLFQTGDSLVATVPAAIVKGLNLRAKEKVYIILKKIGAEASKQ